MSIVTTKVSVDTSSTTIVGVHGEALKRKFLRIRNTDVNAIHVNLDGGTADATDILVAASTGVIEWAGPHGVPQGPITGISITAASDVIVEEGY